MEVRRLSKDGSVHVTDEVFNTLSASIGALLSVIGVGLLLYQAWTQDKMGHFWGLAVYGFGLVNLFLLSALHHGVNASPKTEHHLRQLDYFAIFIMIAGTMTPFCLIVLKKVTIGWVVFALLWILAVFGIAIKAVFPHVPRWLTTALYVGMGWLGALIFPAVCKLLPEGAVWLLVAGGLFYTVGAVLYYLEKPNPIPGRFGFHEIWHLCVLAGAGSHFFMMYFYLLPYRQAG